MAENDLVLGLAAGYHCGDVRPFLVSLAQSGFQGRCVLFVSNTTRDLKCMEELGAEVIPFDRPDRADHVPYNAWRYFLYRDYLAAHPECNGRILLSDVRDVIFQSDPFSHAWGAGLNVTLEDRRMTIGACPYATRWISGHLGESAWKTLRERNISCSGTTLADRKTMLEYLDVLTELLLPFTPGKGMNGYDQGVHNHIVHNRLLQCSLHDNSGPILTLAYKKGEPETDADGDVLNDSGSKATIVHQYDRKPDLFRQIRTRYM